MYVKLNTSLVSTVRSLLYFEWEIDIKINKIQLFFDFLTNLSYFY